MKKITILFSSIAMLFGVGLGVGAAVKGEDKVEKAEATDTNTTVTLYINQFDGGGTWANFSYYLFGGSSGEKTAWPGDAFTDSMKTSTPNEYDQYQYKLTVDTSKYPKLILVGNPATWSGQAQTENLTIADMKNNGIYCGDQIPNTNKFNVGYYGYTTKTVYLLDLKGDVYNTNHYCHAYASGKAGTTWPGVAMTKVAGSNNLYSAEINSALDNVMFNNNGGKQTKAINPVSDGDAFVVYPDNGYNKLTLDAATFVDKYMKFETKWLDDEGNGSCKSAGWYSAAKTAFTNKTADQKSKILEHEPTKYRMEKWAIANGDTFNTSTGAFNANIVRPVALDDKTTNATLATVIITVVSLAAVGGFFFLRKKKLSK